MAKKVVRSYARFIGGIADFNKESLIPDAYSFGRSIDVRSNPQNITILPRTLKESGNTITDLPKWADTIPISLDTYIYGNTGNIYKRTSTPTYSLLHTVPTSHGNGLAYFAEDDFVYYTGDKVIGRYGPVSASAPTFVDDFFGSQGGVPLNTNSLDLESSSSQYASRADTASLSITGNLSIEAMIKPESLPTVGNSMTLVSKWDQSGTLRSYKFDIAAVSGYFGDSSAGNVTISSNTTEAPTDSAATATSGTYVISATNASFAAGQEILIHQTRGTGAGTWQRLTIQSYTAGTITTTTTLNATYSSGAQVRVLLQYGTLTVNTNITYTAKAWNGTVGGILAFIAATLTNNGTITASGSDGTRGQGVIAGATGGGFRGGTSRNTEFASPGQGDSGEGTAGVQVTGQTSNNGNGGGAGVSISG